ncbi:MAG: S41 family peptidase [Sphingomonadales bacterium]|nr:S41 family peptidase [Sphingomonadales bacterium]
MPVRGIWKSRGYGWLLSADSAGYALYDHAGDHCIEFERGSVNDFERGFEAVQPQSQDGLVLRVRNDITNYHFQPVDALPEVSLALDQPRQRDPVSVLDFFGRAFAQDYAFFALRGVDWEELWAEAGTRVTGSTSEEALFEELHRLIAPLRDNHVMLSGMNRIVRSENVADIKALIAREIGVTKTSAHPDSLGKIGGFLTQTVLGGEAKTAGNGAFVWNMLTPSVGYLAVLRLFGISDSDDARCADDLPHARADHATLAGADIAALEQIMDRVLADLGEARALILDIRMNGGGFDRIGMSIAGRFADKKRLAFSKQARDGDGVTPKQDFHTEPSPRRTFDGPVYVLTSARTASAGDILALCMRAIPSSTLVGGPTAGILSDNLRKHLPNGWLTSISNEFYYSPAGDVFEGRGVPVDLETPVFVGEDFAAGYRVALDKAMELAASQSITV